MTIRYVGPGGNDGNSGLSWALRKLTLQGMENTPVVAGDTIYVGPGTYRELLTVGVSGTAGNPITYIGDYLGTNTDGVGGIVRITGSDNDQVAARASCILNGGKNFRTFIGFEIGLSSANLITTNSLAGTNWILQQCLFYQTLTSGACVLINNAGNTTWLFDRCVWNCGLAIGIRFNVSLNNSGHIIKNCIFLGGAIHIQIDACGGVSVTNCLFYSATAVSLFVNTALATGQTFTVNNSIITGGCRVGCQATKTAEFVEDFNNFSGNSTDRTTVTPGAHDNAFPPLFDPRWFFNLVLRGAGPYSPLQLVSPFDLSSDSQLINVAGTSPTNTDMRGTAIQGAQREWGSLEYDPTLKTIGGIHKSRLAQGQ